jgi:hypothetical protein
MTDEEMIRNHAEGVAQAGDALCYFGDVFTRVHGPHPLGHVHDGHKHNFDHQTLLVSGSIRIQASKDGVSKGDKTFTAPCPIVIRADTEHRIEVLAENTVWICAFAVRDMGDPMVAAGSDPYV